MKSKFTKVVWYYCLQCFLWAVIATPQAYGQQIVQAGILLNPLRTADNSVQGALQLQSLYYVPKLAVLGGLSYDKHGNEANDYVYDSQNFTKFLEARYFPYRQQAESLRPIKPFLDCFTFNHRKKASWQSILIGSFYVSAGYSERQTDLQLHLKAAPEKVYQIKVQNRALSLGLGTQFQLSKLIMGVSYNAAFSRPMIEGDELAAFQNKLFTHSFPIALRIEQGFNLKIGLQLF